jgi:hypothetical protein
MARKKAVIGDLVEVKTSAGWAHVECESYKQEAL